MKILLQIVLAFAAIEVWAANAWMQEARKTGARSFALGPFGYAVYEVK